MANIFEMDGQRQGALAKEFRETINKLIVMGYRNIAAQYDCAPTSKTTDQRIIEIYATVVRAFAEAEVQHKEKIPTLFMNRIVFKFLQVFEMCGDEFLDEHLRYEVNKYTLEGLREDYKHELPLFDPSSNESDVKKLRELQALVARSFEQQFLATSAGREEFPYQSLADTILSFSTDVASKVVELAEKAALIKVATSAQAALLDEIAAYHLNVTVNNVMAIKGIDGKHNYDYIEAGICSALLKILTNPANDLEFCKSIVSGRNRERARMYFLRDQKGLEVFDNHIACYAQKHSKPDIMNIPRDQMAIVYYVIRVARLLEVAPEIDRFVVYGINQVLADRNMALQAEVQRLAKL